jgi:beta-glucosidase
VTLQSTLQLPSILNRESTVREWLRDPKGKVVFQPVFQQMMDEAKRIFSPSEEAAGEPDTELMGLLDMPLLSLLDFQEAHMEMPALELVDTLLQQVHGPAQ